MASLSSPLQLRCSALTPLPARQPPTLPHTQHSSSVYTRGNACMHTCTCAHLCVRAVPRQQPPGARGTSTYCSLRWVSERRRQPTDAPVTSSSSSSFSAVSISLSVEQTSTQGHSRALLVLFFQPPGPVLAGGKAAAAPSHFWLLRLPSSPSPLRQKKSIPVCRAHMMAPRCPCIVINGHNSG